MKYSVLTSVLSKTAAVVGLGLIGATNAYAARSADLDVSVLGAGQVDVNDSATYSVTTRNAGNRRANNVQVSVVVPVALSISNHSGECQQSASGLACDLGRIAPGNSHTISFSVVAPASASAHTLVASANTSTRESTLSNNDDTLAVQVIDPTPPPPASFPITTDTDLLLEMCTSLSGPIVWADCTPGSLLTHAVTLKVGGVADTHDPGFTGNWNQSSSSEVEMNFFNALDNSAMSTMTGVATSSACFEGTTVFHQGLGHGAWRGCKP